MNNHLPGFRTSSARRGRRRPSILATSVAVLILIVVGFAILERNRGKTSHAPIPTPPATTALSPTNTPPATATVLVEHTSKWVVALAPTTTPTPWPTLPPPVRATPRPDPSPTPANFECVTYQWSARQVFIPSAQVMVEIHAVNACNRDIGPLELWFEITGWRQGDRIQSVRGHPFERIRRGGSDFITIGLPGSIDWYDEIVVEILD